MHTSSDPGAGLGTASNGVLGARISGGAYCGPWAAMRSTGGGLLQAGRARQMQQAYRSGYRVGQHTMLPSCQPSHAAPVTH